MTQLLFSPLKSNDVTFKKRIGIWCISALVPWVVLGSSWWSIEARDAIGNRTAEQLDMAGVLHKITGLPVMAVDGITDAARADGLIKSIQG